MKRPRTPEQYGLPTISASDWFTPDWLFRDLDARFGPFTLDAAAADDNAKCVEYFTERQDGLTQAWRGRVWCNPPYVGLLRWVKKAYEEVASGRAERVLLLLLAHTSTEWFHEWALPFARLHWIRGKVKFGGRNKSALMPSVAVIFDARSIGGPS